MCVVWTFDGAGRLGSGWEGAGVDEADIAFG
jgi:hypothetical protein